LPGREKEAAALTISEPPAVSHENVAARDKLGHD